ncbi:uncharacterized protein LOC113421810 [Notechis scutatus]|uniref:Uncharacterized protein LOC113421810 n=1 Tax=Notechis scutatus TaxID=8663 RepID=A0A6J1VE75_9SAUR|nr:uncharacterized protein LOC113421810 [Notechis scutatus]
MAKAQANQQAAIAKAQAQVELLERQRETAAKTARATAWQKAANTASLNFDLEDLGEESPDTRVKAYMNEQHSFRNEQMEPLQLPNNDPATALRLSWKRLDELYGTFGDVEATLLDSLNSFPKIPIDKPHRIIDLANILVQLRMAQWDPNLLGLTCLDHVDTQNKIVRKLPQNLRVRILSGCTFQSRNQKQVTGTLKEKFLLVDGQIAITGSYSFTWTDARLNRHLVTRLTGEVTKVFDHEFRTLYAASCPLPALETTPHLEVASAAPLPSTNGPDVTPYISVLDGVQLSNRIAERRSVAPQPVAKSQAGAWELVLASPATAEDPMLPAPAPKPSLRNQLAAWRGVDYSGGGQQGPPDGPSALSDIYRNVQRNRLSTAKTTGARPSKSLWDLSCLSQLSGSGTIGWGRNGIDSAEEAKKWGYQATPAKELMKHRESGHVPEEARMPFYMVHGRMNPSPGYIPLGRLQGQLYHKPPNIGLARTWGHPPNPQYGHPPRF